MPLETKYSRSKACHGSFTTDAAANCGHNLPTHIQNPIGKRGAGSQNACTAGQAATKPACTPSQQNRLCPKTQAQPAPTFSKLRCQACSQLPQPYCKTTGSPSPRTRPAICRGHSIAQRNVMQQVCIKSKFILCLRPFNIHAAKNKPIQQTTFQYINSNSLKRATSCCMQIPDLALHVLCVLQPITGSERSCLNVACFYSCQLQHHSSYCQH